MARKTIKCAPVSEIEIITAEGETTLLRFDILMLQELQSEAGSLMEATKKGIGELAALVVYAGAKNQDASMTMEKARKMIVCMNPLEVQEIVNEFSQSMGVVADGELQDAAKKVMAQFLARMK